MHFFVFFRWVENVRWRRLCVSNQLAILISSSLCSDDHFLYFFIFGLLVPLKIEVCDTKS